MELLRGGSVDHFREQLVSEQGGAPEGAVSGSVQRSGGLLSFMAVTLPLGSPDKTWREMHEALATLDEGAWMGEESLSRVSKRERKQMGMDRYFSHEVATQLGWSHLNLGQASRAFDRIDAMASLTVEDIRRVWTRYVMEGDPSKLYGNGGR